jgi:kynurenine formamidase
MWSYKEKWRNNIRVLQSKPTTVYRFDLCSHTGTYLQTCQHKFDVSKPLDGCDVSEFVRRCKVLILESALNSSVVSVDSLDECLTVNQIKLDEGDSVLLATGWGMKHREPYFVSAAPSFSEQLVERLCAVGLSFLAVDTPVIDNTNAPLRAVELLFKSNENMLMLAPVTVDPKTVKTGVYNITALPTKIENVCASPCRAILSPTA